jgi:hypothetical protein
MFVATRSSMMQINWSGVIVFAAFCVLLGTALSRPAWMPVAEGVATVLILFALAGFLIPRFRKRARP